LAQSWLANGNILIREGKHDEASALLDSAERLISDKPYYSLLGQITQNRAVIYGFRQRSHEAMASMERSVAYYERAGQKRYLVAGLNNLGVYLFWLGEIDRAHSNWERAARLAAELGHAPTEAMALEGLAQIDILRGDYVAAESKLKSAMEIVNAINSKWYEASRP
jgi:tetratricopeptide (TPR) repeat protein